MIVCVWGGGRETENVGETIWEMGESSSKILCTLKYYTVYEFRVIVFLECVEFKILSESQY